MSGSTFLHTPGRAGWVPADCRTRWGVWLPARGSARRLTENLLKHKQQQEQTCAWEVSGSSDSLKGTTSGSIKGPTELQVWNGGCVKGSRANCWSWSGSIFKTMNASGTSSPRVQPKSSGCPACSPPRATNRSGLGGRNPGVASGWGMQGGEVTPVCCFSS